MDSNLNSNFLVMEVENIVDPARHWETKNLQQVLKFRESADHLLNKIGEAKMNHFMPKDSLNVINGLQWQCRDFKA